MLRLNGLKNTLVLPLAIGALAAIHFNNAQAATSDPDVNLHMDWCAGDWGVNEGAPEAIDYANAAIAAGYPNQVSAIVGIINQIPGASPNILKRPPVIDAARALVNVNSEIAVQLALTCQNHNSGVKSLLLKKKDAVADWLRG